MIELKKHLMGVDLTVSVSDEGVIESVNLGDEEIDLSEVRFKNDAPEYQPCREPWVDLDTLMYDQISEAIVTAAHERRQRDRMMAVRARGEQ